MVMKLAFFDKVQKLIQSREAKVEENLSKAHLAKLQSESEIKDSNFLEILTNARKEAQMIISKAIEEANDQKQTVVKEAQAKAQNEINQELEEFSKQKNELRDTLDSKIEEIHSFALNKFLEEVEGKRALTV